jgi:hypothetical protein
MEALGANKELWRNKSVSFLNEFTEANPQWHAVADRPLETGLPTDIPGMREEYLHFTGAGLLVLCGVGHSILGEGVNPDGNLDERQKEMVRQLASVDWSRRNNLWQGYLIGPQGNVTPHKVNITLAVAKVKKAIGLPLTNKEEQFILKAELGQPVPTT